MFFLSYTKYCKTTKEIVWRDNISIYYTLENANKIERCFFNVCGVARYSQRFLSHCFLPYSNRVVYIHLQKFHHCATIYSIVTRSKVFSQTKLSCLFVCFIQEHFTIKFQWRLEHLHQHRQCRRRRRRRHQQHHL